MKDKSKSLADQLFPEIFELENEILNIPPEQRKLNTETYDFTVSTINEYIKEKHIVIPRCTFTLADEKRIDKYE